MPMGACCASGADWQSLIPRVKHLAREVWLSTPRHSAAVTLDDLVQLGQIALWKASRTFRPEAGAELWTYAKTGVRGAMTRALRRAGRVRVVTQQDLTKVPAPERDADGALDAQAEWLADKPIEKGRAWTVRGLAERAGISERAIRKRIEAGALRARRVRGQWRIPDLAAQDLLQRR